MHTTSPKSETAAGSQNARKYLVVSKSGDRDFDSAWTNEVTFTLAEAMENRRDTAKVISQEYDDIDEEDALDFIEIVPAEEDSDEALAESVSHLEFDVTHDVNPGESVCYATVPGEDFGFTINSAYGAWGSFPDDNCIGWRKSAKAIALGAFDSEAIADALSKRLAEIDPEFFD